MIQFNLVSFFWLIMRLEQETNSCQQASHMHSDPLKARDKERESIIRFLTGAKPQCEELGLTFSVKHISRMLRDAQEGDETFGDFVSFYDELVNRISDEIGDYLFFGVNKERVGFYSGAIERFGKPTLEKFPSCVLEVEEAGKCYATGRYTACAFHLMRIIEVGLRALGKSLNEAFDPKKNPTWEAVLRKCDEELKKPLKDRCAEWRADEVFFSEATANLRAVKDAWRNPTMHIEHIYDEEKALDVFNSVRAFMRHLASKLAE